MAADKDMKKTAALIKDSNKKAFTEGQAKAKDIVKFIEKAESPEELKEILKLVKELKTKMDKAFETQVRVLTVAIANAGKKK